MFNAHRFLLHSISGWRVINKKSCTPECASAKRFERGCPTPQSVVIKRVYPGEKVMLRTNSTILLLKYALL